MIGSRPTLRALGCCLGAACLAALGSGVPARAQPAVPHSRSDEALERAQDLTRAGRFDEAVTTLEGAVQLTHGQAAEVEMALAKAYLDAGARDKALGAARRALALAPEPTIERDARLMVCQIRPLPAPDAAAVAAGAPREVGDRVIRPKVLFSVSPVYPEDLRKARAQGTVIVRAVIDEEGCVTRASALPGAAPGFEQAALAVLPLWIFHPATFQGQPVKVHYTLTTNFAIDETPPKRQP